MKYIDCDKLTERVKQLITSARRNDWPIAEDYMRRVLGIIDSLQQEQPEVDLELEKEIDSYYGIYRKEGKTYDIEDGEECADWKEMFNPYAEIDFARHFYELGLKARKENKYGSTR